MRRLIRLASATGKPDLARLAHVESRSLAYDGARVLDADRNLLRCWAVDRSSGDVGLLRRNLRRIQAIELEPDA